MEKTVYSIAQRRNFILTLGLGSIATAAALLAGKQVKAAEMEQAATERPAKKGYHESEHVKHYYRSARI